LSQEQNQPTLAQSFFRSQLAAFAGSLVDFLAVIFFTEVANIWYVYSTALGALIGAIVNFLLGRYWVFLATESKMRYQAMRYAIVSLGSLLLNTLGVYLFTDYGGLNYIYSKLIAGLLVGVFYNFVLQKKFVYT